MSANIINQSKALSVLKSKSVLSTSLYQYIYNIYIMLVYLVVTMNIKLIKSLEDQDIKIKRY